jgi:hypothetical protein
LTVLRPATQRATRPCTYGKSTIHGRQQES